MIPKEDTQQERLVADCLIDLGIRYADQHEFNPYIVDFYIRDLKMVIEADGIYGHFREKDRKRDADLLEYDEVEHVVHIKETTKTKIKEAIWQALRKLDEEY